MWFFYGITLFGFVITFSVTLLYGLMAPWYKSDTGKSFFILLSAESLLLLNSALRIIFDKAEWTTVVGLLLFVVYTVAMSFIGWNVYQAQIARYHKNKKKKVSP